jgi:hypothetical protein
MDKEEMQIYLEELEITNKNLIIDVSKRDEKIDKLKD